MLALRYVYVLALAVLVGGIIAIGGIAAPATFAALVQHDAAAGRVLAGLAFGEVLRRYYLASYAAGGVLLLSLAAMALLGPRPPAFFIRCAIAFTMLALMLYSGIVITSQIAGLQQEIGVAVSSLAVGDPRRMLFGRLHGLATGFMAATGLGGLALLYWEAKDS